MNVEHTLIELAHHARSAEALREGALRALGDALEADVGIFIARGAGRVARTTRGLGAAHEAVMDAAWDRTGLEVRPVKERAIQEGAATDRRVLGAALRRTTLYREVMAPIGGTETLFLVPSAGGHALGLLTLGRCGGSFSDAAMARARSWVPALSVACRATAEVPCGPPLTTTESDLLEYLSLGLDTRQIALARGTSFFTVRNQLSALYRKLEVANRAEAIGRMRARR
jgi:DNA-binding CsgD family transcriptional regulator